MNALHYTLNDAPPWDTVVSAAPVMPSGSYVAIVAASGAPFGGPAGWAARLMRSDGTAPSDLSGGSLTCTTNGAFILAAIESLKSCPPGSIVTIVTDSTYLADGVNSRRYAWRRAGWVKNGKPVPNADLWRLLDAQANRLRVKARWVRIGAGDAERLAVHRLAVQGSISVQGVTR